MNAREIIENETPKQFMARHAGVVGRLTVDKIRRAQAAIIGHYQTDDWDAILAAAARLRRGSEHEVGEDGSGREYCRRCGVLGDSDVRLPDPIYHPDWWQPYR